VPRSQHLGQVAAAAASQSPQINLFAQASLQTILTISAGQTVRFSFPVQQFADHASGVVLWWYPSMTKCVASSFIVEGFHDLDALARA